METHILETIETQHVVCHILSDHTAMIRAKAGANINGETALEATGFIAKSMPGDYAIIIDREEDYSITPVPVFNVINKMEHLKALAIVTHMDHSATMTDLDRMLYKGELEVFDSVESAQEWIDTLLGIDKT